MMENPLYLFKKCNKPSKTLSYLKFSNTMWIYVRGIFIVLNLEITFVVVLFLILLFFFKIFDANWIICNVSSNCIFDDSIWDISNILHWLDDPIVSFNSWDILL